MIIVTD